MFATIAQRWLEQGTANQMKNVLLVSKVFCICTRRIHICDGAFIL